MPHGLPRKFRIAFLLQAVIVSAAIVLGIFLVSAVIKHSLIKNALQVEAAHYWELHATSAAQPPPNTHAMRGYLVERGHSITSLPPNLRELAPGFHELVADDQLVLVDVQPVGRLYLVFLRSQAERLAFWFGTVPIALALLVIYFVSWLTYRSSRRLVSPITWLARRVAHWDPQRPDAAELDPAHLPPDMQGEARQLADALRGLAERVGEQVERERQFTRDASHELRTPLTVIRVASDMALANEALDARTIRSLDRIQRAGRDMEAVIDAFLILAREADIAPQAEHFAVASVVEDEVENASALLEGRPVALVLQLNADPVIHAPRRVLNVVVSNLLRNAASYTDQGRVEVALEQDHIQVRDTGIGMDAAQLAQAFQPFYRADPARPNGTGLGLSIVRRLCDRFGWRVALESQPGVGTVATVWFSEAGAPPPPPTARD